MEAQVSFQDVDTYMLAHNWLGLLVIIVLVFIVVWALIKLAKGSEEASEMAVESNRDVSKTAIRDITKVSEKAIQRIERRENASRHTHKN